MSNFPVCDVTFEDGTKVAAFLIVQFGERLTLQVVQVETGVSIQPGMTITFREGRREAEGSVLWVPPLMLNPTLFIVQLQPQVAPVSVPHILS